MFSVIFKKKKQRKVRTGTYLTAPHPKILAGLVEERELAGEEESEETEASALGQGWVREAGSLGTSQGTEGAPWLGVGALAVGCDCASFGLLCAD